MVAFWEQTAEALELVVDICARWILVCCESEHVIHLAIYIWLNTHPSSLEANGFGQFCACTGANLETLFRKKKYFFNYNIRQVLGANCALAPIIKIIISTIAATLVAAHQPIIIKVFCKNFDSSGTILSCPSRNFNNKYEPFSCSIGVKIASRAL